MKKTWVRALALILALMLLLTTFCTSALAANKFSNIKGTANKGPASKTWTITVKTGKTWFSNPKITFAFGQGFGKTNDKQWLTSYSYWVIDVYDSKGREVDWANTYNNSNAVIDGWFLGRLKKNSTYKIKIQERASWRASGNKGVLNWMVAPTWQIGSTNNIASIKWA